MRIAFILFFLFSLSVYTQRSDFRDIDFKKADSIAQNYKGASLKNLPALTHHLTVALETEVEKFRAIYTWVSTNIENDYNSYLKISHKRKRLANDRQAFLNWNTGITPKVFEKLLKENKTACTGYAYLVKEMATLAGLKCVIVDGYARTPTLLLKENNSPNHSWNKIEINNKWYVCDATWSAGETMLINGSPFFNPDYFDGYFLADPVLFVKNHFAIDKNQIEQTNENRFTSFLSGPVIYKEAFRAPIIPVFPLEMHQNINREDIVTFKLNVPNNYFGDIQLLLHKGGVKKLSNPHILRNDNEISIVQKFEKKGLYDVHISVENELIATYVVKVK